MLLYNRSACEAADDVLVELIDYCYRKFSQMLAVCEKLEDGQYIRPDVQLVKNLLNQTKDQEMEENIDDINFKCTIACFSIIRFISDHLETLPLPIIH